NMTPSSDAMNASRKTRDCPFSFRMTALLCDAGRVRSIRPAPRLRLLVAVEVVQLARVGVVVGGLLAGLQQVLGGQGVRAGQRRGSAAGLAANDVAESAVDTDCTNRDQGDDDDVLRHALPAHLPAFGTHDSLLLCVSGWMQRGVFFSPRRVLRSA